MSKMKKRLKRYKKVIFIAFIFSFILFISIKIKGSYELKGEIVDIYFNDKYTILLNSKESLYSISFDKKINLRSIELNDYVSIKTNGIIMESYPAQTKGLDIKLLESKEKNNIKDVNTYVLNASGDYYNDMLNNNFYRFNTKVLNNKDEYMEFQNEMSINNNFDLDEIFKDNFIVISYSYMSSTPKLENKLIYTNDNNLFIEINIDSDDNETDDLICRGFIYIINKNYSSIDNVFTLSNFIVK